MTQDPAWGDWGESDVCGLCGAGQGEGVCQHHLATFDHRRVAQDGSDVGLAEGQLLESGELARFFRVLHSDVSKAWSGGGELPQVWSDTPELELVALMMRRFLVGFDSVGPDDDPGKRMELAKQQLVEVAVDCVCSSLQGTVSSHPNDGVLFQSSRYVFGGDGATKVTDLWCRDPQGALRAMSQRVASLLDERDRG